MRKLTIILIVVFISASISLAQTNAPVEAEAYMYGHVLGSVTVDDVSTDGRTISLKGIQYWPRLSSSTEMPPEKDFAKEALHDQVWTLHADMQQNEKSVAEIRVAMVKTMRQNPLVRDVREPDDPNLNWFEYRLKDDPYEDWICLEDIGTTNDFLSYEQKLQTALDTLYLRIEHGWTIVVSPDGGFFVPPNARDNQVERIRDEIASAIDGNWSGDLLTAKEVQMFRSPLDIVAATERFNSISRQED